MYVLNKEGYCLDINKGYLEMLCHVESQSVHPHPNKQRNKQRKACRTPLLPHVS